MTTSRFVPTALELVTPDSVNGLVELVDWTQSQPMGTCVVIGAYAGEVPSVLAETGEFQIVYCVDTWSKPGGALAERYFKARQSARPKMWSVKMASVHASKRFADATLDLVYINAVENDKQIARDLRLWIPKVRPRGVIAGAGYRTNPMPAAFTKVARAIQPRIVKNTVGEHFGEIDMTFCDGSWAHRL